PVCDSEPLSVFGLITGEHRSGDSFPDRVFPVCNSEFSITAAFLAHCLAACPPIAPVEQEQPAGQIRGCGGRECAPSTARQRDHLGALTRLAGGRFLATDARNQWVLTGCREGPLIFGLGNGVHLTRRRLASLIFRQRSGSASLGRAALRAAAR